jgi:hypothetical protein
MRTRCCPGCGLELQPPAGVRWYQPVADSEPGPMVTAVAPYGVPPALSVLRVRDILITKPAGNGNR